MSNESQQVHKASRTRTSCGDVCWSRRRYTIVSRSPDFTARKALELAGECVMQLASAPGRSTTGLQAPGPLGKWILQQTASLAQGSSPEYFRCSTLASTCSSQEAAMCVCDQQRRLQDASWLGCSKCARGPQLWPRLCINSSSLPAALHTWPTLLVESAPTMKPLDL